MKHEIIVEKLIKYLEDDEDLKFLMEKAINQAKALNPDKQTNPTQSLEELYNHLDWACKCMPWDVTHKKYPTLYLDINQSINHFWFLFGQKLEELEDYDYYLPTLEYHEPIRSWIRDFSNTWGDFLNTKESWNDDYFNLQFKDDSFGMNTGWYGNKNIWHTYNEFFSRKLIDPSVRPIGEAELISPADSSPAGIWHIDNFGFINDPSLSVKGHAVYKVGSILGPFSKYKDSFNGGTLTHTFLDVNDYHRYHFPIDGEILEMQKIEGCNAVGGHTDYNPETKRYKLDCNDVNWQIIETRDSIVLDTKFGHVAIVPIGMSQVCSCNFEDNLEIGMKVKKGDTLGYFLFGGSDIVMLFEKGVDVKLLFENNKHLLMGENYASLKLK